MATAQPEQARVARGLTDAPLSRIAPFMTVEKLSISQAIARDFGLVTTWIADHTTQIAISGLIGLIIVAVLMAAKWGGKRLCLADPTHDHWRTTIGRALSKIGLWFMVAAAAQIVAVYADAPAAIARTIYFFFVIAAALQGAIFARELILGAIEHRATESALLGNALNIIRLLTTFALFAIAVVLILSNLGVNVTGLVAGLGIGGIAIGLAAQGIFRDLFAALSILLDRPFRLGDTIKFGDATGKVENIGLKTTRIRSLDGEQIIMSNDKLLDQQIRNLHGISERRVVLKLPLAYDNDPEDINVLPDRLKALVEATEHCRFDHAWLDSFAAKGSALEVMFHVTTGEAEARDRARHKVMIETLRVVRELGIKAGEPDS